MRVLHISSGNFYGSVESLVVAAARFRRLYPSMDPHFAVCFEGRLSRDLTAAGVPVYQLGAVRVSRPMTIWNARRRLRILLDEKPFDAVICHSPWPHSIFAPVVRSVGKPLIFWLHDTTAGRHWSERWASITRPDLSICNSEFTRGTLDNIFPGVASCVIHTPVPLVSHVFTLAEISATRASLDTPEEAVVVIQPSRMEEWKGQRLHLEALSRLKHIPNWIAWQAGRPQRPYEERYYQSLQEAAAGYGIADRMRWAGKVADVQQLLAAAHLHCQPNTDPEPLGLAFLEAMAARLPVVTTALGGALEVVSEDCGILVPPGDVSALAAALEKLLTDPELRVRLGSAGPARVKMLCDPETQIGKLGRALKSVIRTVAA